MRNALQLCVKKPAIYMDIFSGTTSLLMYLQNAIHCFTVTFGHLSCDFSTLDMCGYMDVSYGRYHWLRDPVEGKTESKLLWVPLITIRKQSLACERIEFVKPMT